jgi:hypothetical protein
MIRKFSHKGTKVTKKRTAIAVPLFSSKRKERKGRKKTGNVGAQHAAAVLHRCALRSCLVAYRLYNCFTKPLDSIS